MQTNKLSPFKYSSTNKRYYTLDYYFKKQFGSKVGRISINAGFTCPNIDGTKGFDGCTFCNTLGSGDFAGNPQDDLLNQWDIGKKQMEKKWPDARFIAYFQAFTNTYAPLEILKEKFEIFVNKKDCIGLSIGTRADCLDDEIIEYLETISKRTFLLVELGLQTSNNKTSSIINRAHTTEEFELVVKKLRQKNINVVVHIINGLPKETKEDMLNTVNFINTLNIQGIKIHLLHVMQDTKLVGQLNNKFLKLLTKEEYINIVVKQLEILNPNIVIHRLTGDAPSDIFIGPIWSKKKTVVLNDIDKELVNKNTYQGKKYQKSIEDTYEHTN